MNIAEILKAALEDEATFAEAEALYCESFKDSETFSVSSGFVIREDLVIHLMQDIYAPCPKDAPDWFDPEIIKQGYPREEAEVLVDGGIEFVELVNYKGESEGFQLAARAQHLRTFFGKHSYK